MSEAEPGALPVLLPPGFARDPEEPRRRTARLGWWALAIALLLHAAVIALLLIDWHWAIPVEAEAIPVKIVVLPPPPPPPPPPTTEQSPPPPPEPPPTYAESGPDQRTTAPPPAETPAPETAAPPPTPAAPEPAEPEKPEPAPPHPEKHAVPREAPKPKPHKETAKLEPKEAETPRAPHPAPRHLIEIEPGERAETGDPYLNLLVSVLERHRIFPNAVGQFGLPVEGVAIYRIIIDRAGNLQELALEHSSGVPALDRAGEAIIRNSMPFPAVPPQHPGARIALTLKLPLYSER